MRRLTTPALLALLALAAPAAAAAAPGVQFGLQDDAWLTAGPGPTSVGGRVAVLKRLGVKIVRFNLRWDAVAARRPARPTSPADPAYDWSSADPLLRALHKAGIPALLTIVGAPAWTNGGRGPNTAPSSPSAIAGFARAAAHRYPWVRKWAIWNEPNSTVFLRPVSPQVYVQRLLNPAYAALHATLRGIQVAGGVTAPRANSGLSPLAWVKGMGAAHARLDAYGHNPYPGSPLETPFGPRCPTCNAVTMANLETLIRAVNTAFGRKPIWITEYGYQTRPQDPYFGVPYARQALFVGEAALRAYLMPQVALMIQFLFRDEPEVGGWQSGFQTVTGRTKPSFDAFRLPLAQMSRHGSTTVVWGQVRPRSGAQPYVLQELRGSRWTALGGAARTNAAGILVRTLRAGRGTQLRLYSPRDRAYSHTLAVT